MEGESAGEAVCWSRDSTGSQGVAFANIGKSRTPDSILAIAAPHYRDQARGGRRAEVRSVFATAAAQNCAQAADHPG